MSARYPNPDVDLHRAYPRTDWRDDAACLGEDVETFYVPGDKWSSHPDVAAKAKAICDRCPLSSFEACLKDALERGDKHAWRANTTPSQRDQLRRKAKRPSRAKPTKCQNVRHDITKPDALNAKGWCRQCARDKEARYRKRRGYAA